MDRYKETFETWNKVASLYQDKFMDLNLYNDTYDFVCNSIKKDNPTLLEIGCGPGNITRYLLSKRPDFDIFATDIAPNMIELAKRNNPSASFAVMDCRHIDQIRMRFDALICGFCLPYLSHTDCEKLIVDSADLLHEDGLLYVSYVDGNSKHSGFQTTSTGDRTYFYFHSTDLIKLHLVKNNFELIRIFEIAYKKSETDTDIHTILIAKQKSLFLEVIA